MAALFTPAQESRIRAIVGEELVARLTPGRTSTAAKAPASTKASSTAKPNTFVTDVIAGGRKHACGYATPCAKTFRTVARTTNHFGH